MTHNATDNTAKEKSLQPTTFTTNSDVQSSYDAEFDFLYSAVPFGEYPEATAADMRNETTAAAKKQLE
jgi:hypothetical protein